MRPGGSIVSFPLREVLIIAKIVDYAGNYADVSEFEIKEIVEIVNTIDTSCTTAGKTAGLSEDE